MTEPGATENLPAPRRAPAPAVRQGLADRTAGMLAHPEPEIRWRRQVGPDTEVWVRVDGPLVIGDELVGIASGAPLSARPSALPRIGLWEDSRAMRSPQIRTDEPKPSRRVEGGWEWCRVWRDLVIVAGGRDRRTRRLRLAGLHPLTGAVAWQHETAGDEVKMWFRWLQETDGVTTLVDSQDADERIGLLDLTTRRPRWRIPRARLREPGDRPGTAAADVHVVHDRRTEIFAGLDVRDGAVLWSTEPTPGPTVAAGVTGDHVVRLLYRFPPQAVKGRLCDCRRPAPAGDEPNECRSCGRPLKPWISVEVRDRASGDRRWTHRWPWTGSWSGVYHGAMAVRGEAVLTWEGGFLRARRIADGRPLWSVPGVSVRRRFMDLPDGGVSRIFTECDMDSPRQWAWLRFHERAGDGGLEFDDVLVHAPTGRVVRLEGVFHHTEDDLVLTLSGGTLTCFALPLRERP